MTLNDLLYPQGVGAMGYADLLDAAEASLEEHGHRWPADEHKVDCQHCLQARWIGERKAEVSKFTEGK